MDLDAQFFERLMLSVTIRLGLHELDHRAFQSAARGTHHCADRGGGFSLAVAGIEHQQPFGLLAIIVAAPFVSLFSHFGKIMAVVMNIGQTVMNIPTAVS